MMVLQVQGASSVDSHDSNLCAQPSERALGWLVFERDVVWHRQFHLGPPCGTALDFESGANLLRPLVHACQAPVSLTPCVEHLGIDSASVVANPHAQVNVGIFKFKFDAFRLGMTKCVGQRLSANSVNLMSDGRPQRLLVRRPTEAVRPLRPTLRRIPRLIRPMP